MALLRGSTQILDASINRPKLSADFLNGSNWDITDGNNNFTITGLVAGTNPFDAVNYQQLIDLIEGQRVREVRVITDTNQSLTGAATIDGVVLAGDGTKANSDRVFVHGQTTSTQDGIYYVNTGGAWVRTEDFALGFEARSCKILVSEGTVSADTQWFITNDKGGDVVGTANLVAVQTGSSGMLGANNGLTLSGSDIILGGTLNQGTTVAQATNALTFSGGAFTVDGGATDVLLLRSGGDVSLVSGTGDVTVSSMSADIHINALTVVDFFDNEMQMSTSMGGNLLPLTVTTTVDHGSGTSAGDLMDDFVATFTDIGIVNAIMENRDAISATSSLYSANGTLTGNRAVTLDENSLSFVGSQNANEIVSFGATSTEINSFGVSTIANITFTSTSGIFEVTSSNFNIGNTSNAYTIGHQPDGTVALAIATTGYVDSAISSGYSFSNGLTSTGSGPIAVTLGGNLDAGTTTIGVTSGRNLDFIGTFSGPGQARIRHEINNTDSGNYSRYTISDSGVQLWTGAQAYGATGFESEISMGMGALSLSVEDTDSSQLTRIHVGSLTITDTINNRGMRYFADYSSGYTNRSLVDKEYVDSLVASGGETVGSEHIVTGTDVTNGYIDITVVTGMTNAKIFLNGNRLGSGEVSYASTGRVTFGGTQVITATDQVIVDFIDA